MKDNDYHLRIFHNPNIDNRVLDAGGRDSPFFNPFVFTLSKIATFIPNFVRISETEYAAGQVPITKTSTLKFINFDNLIYILFLFFKYVF